jgi:hypothetical protein
MAILPAFSTPGRIADAHPEIWSGTVGGLVARYAARFPQFYDPTATDTPDDAEVATVVWSAFPGSLRGAPRETLEIADGFRGAQDEYCEWGVERNGEGKITRVTFTTEVPEYWAHLFETELETVRELYRELVGVEVDPDRLVKPDGAYLADNEWNRSTTGRPAHLMQPSNNLGAAVDLAANATVLRERDGVPVTGNQELVECGGLGEPLRNSDPSIAAAINNAAATGAEITLNDPPGLYIDGLMTGGMATPDGEDPGAFWTVERGEPTHVVRAVYEVPEGRGYVVGDIRIGGEPIEFGGQLAVRVPIRIEAVVKPESHSPSRRPCVS